MAAGSGTHHWACQRQQLQHPITLHHFQRRRRVTQQVTREHIIPLSVGVLNDWSCLMSPCDKKVALNCATLWPESFYAWPYRQAFSFLWLAIAQNAPSLTITINITEKFALREAVRGWNMTVCRHSKLEGGFGLTHPSSSCSPRW